MRLNELQEAQGWTDQTMLGLALNFIETSGNNEAFIAHLEENAEFENTTGLSEDHEANWIDRHSVNCYFCGNLVDERECQPADKYNGGDGGDICPTCLQEYK